jgi:predicted Ser/Thr protein kinase
MVGRTIGKYRVVAKLGRGGMGTVYRAVDETLDREVAIKILNPELADSDVMKRFRAEASMLAKLNHPAIATIYELHRSDEDLLMVMEFVRGESLDQFVQRSGPVEPERAAYLVAQVLDAIGHAHAAGIIHRDLKPSNVMVTEHGAVKIMDFGIARVRGAEHMTSDGYMMGTPAYMSPEQVLCQEVDGRSDLYSVGVMFYRLLTGKLPFEADTAIGMVQKQISDTPTPARLHRADLPSWAVAILDRALAKSPADRYQTAEELRGALLDAIQGGATEATTLLPATALGRPKPPARTADPDGETTIAPPPPDPATQMATVPQAVAPRRMASAPVAAVEPKTPIAAAESKLVPLAAAEPKPTPVADPGGPLKAGSPAAARRKSNTPAIAAAIVALVAVATVVIGFVTWRRSQTAPAATSASADASVATPAAAPPPAAAPDAPASTVADPTPLPAAADAAVTPPPASAAPPSPTTPPPDAPAPARNPATAGATSAATRPPRTSRGTTPSAAETPTPAPAPEPPAPVIVATTPPKPAVQFRAKLLVKDDDKARERDATVRLADGQVTVTGPDRTILSAMPYDAVLSVIYSKSKQPLWDGPAGATPIQQVDGGAFGFFKGGRHWVSLRTKERFVVLRVEENQVPSVLSLIEERTGKTTVRVAEPKGNQ